MTGLVGHLIERRKSIPVKIGSVTVGGDKPIVVQSMTNTDTADIDGTVEQVEALHRAGSEIVRITVDREEAAQSVPYIKEKLLAAKRANVKHVVLPATCKADYDDLADQVKEGVEVYFVSDYAEVAEIAFQ